jgi:hypothetical protein
MHTRLQSFRHVAIAAACAVTCVAKAQDATEIGRPAPVLPVESEAPPRLIVYPALAAPLARGVVILQYRTEQMRILPVFGTNAVDVSPRVGHLHVTVDDGPGTWAHTSGDPIIVVGLAPGPHTLLIEVADPTHKILTRQSVSVTVPERASDGPRR